MLEENGQSSPLIISDYWTFNMEALIRATAAQDAECQLSDSDRGPQTNRWFKLLAIPF